MYGSCTLVHDRVHRTRPYIGRAHDIVRAVYCTRSCTRAMYIHGQCTRPSIRSCTHVHGRLTVVYMARIQPCILSCLILTAVYTVRVLGLYTAVYTACTWPSTRSCARLHGPYTKPTEFWTFSQTVVITSVNKTKHHFAFTGSLLNME